MLVTLWSITLGISRYIFTEYMLSFSTHFQLEPMRCRDNMYPVNMYRVIPSVIDHKVTDISWKLDTINKCCTGWFIRPKTWVGLTWTLGVPLSAQFCLGWLEFRRNGCAAGQDVGTPKSKSTQSRSRSRWITLYTYCEICVLKFRVFPLLTHGSH